MNRTLQVLDLTSTRLTAAGATSLAEALRCVLMCLVMLLYDVVSHHVCIVWDVPDVESDLHSSGSVLRLLVYIIYTE